MSLLTKLFPASPSLDVYFTARSSLKGRVESLLHRQPVFLPPVSLSDVLILYKLGLTPFPTTPSPRVHSRARRILAPRLIRTTQRLPHALPVSC